jgi:arylformamidase
MRIYDVTQELFGCVVFPGDPAPKRQILSSMKEGALYNLTALSMCAHNGTHVDAPHHFIEDGKGVDEIPLSKTVGWAYVAEHEGEVGAMDATDILNRARAISPEAAKRILLKGHLTVTEAAAEVFAAEGIELLGNESQTVGPEDKPRNVHLILLGAEVVLLEGIRLGEVEEGVYFLFAAPLCLGGADGAPCRAVLVQNL